MTDNRIICFSLFSFFFTVCAYPQTPDFFPDTGAAAIYQHCRALESRGSVLMLSFRPGDEDFHAAAYFRLNSGVKVLSAYCTNGESEETDFAELLPQQNAALRREEAAMAMTALGGNVFFLNLPDIASFSSLAELQSLWNPDTVKNRIAKLIQRVQPRIILLPSSQELYDPVLLQYIQQVVVQVVQEMFPGHNSGQKKKRTALPMILSSSDRSTGNRTIHLETSRLHPIWKISYDSIGTQVFQSYKSISLHRSFLLKSKPVYSQIHLSKSQETIKTLDSFLKEEATPSLQSVAKEIQGCIRDIEKKKYSTNHILTSLRLLLKNIDQLLLRTKDTSSRERHQLTDWKGDLEGLRTALLGIHADYSLDYSVVTDRQVLFFSIDTIKNIPSSGTTTVLFPSVNRDWVVNESKVSQYPVEYKKQFRLLSPQDLEYDLPIEQVYEKRPLSGRLFPVILIHQNADTNKNFIYHFTIRMKYAPRFTAEVMNPIVYCRDGERVIIRLTNHSRDGVSDILTIKDSLVSAPSVRVTLSEKESVSIDTLVLTWKKNISEGQYIIPVQYGGQRIAHVVAKYFAVVADTNRSILVLTSREQSQIVHAVEQLGGKDVRIVPFKNFEVKDLSGRDVVILDRRLLTVSPPSVEERKEMLDYVTQGGHLLIFAQDSKAWNAAPWIDHVYFMSTMQWSASSPIKFYERSTLPVYPNLLEENVSEHWIFQRAYNIITIGAASSSVQTLASSGTGEPLVITTVVGRGRITYVDLALGPQLMSVHGGVVRLLSNIISLK